MSGKKQANKKHTPATSGSMPHFDVRLSQRIDNVSKTSLSLNNSNNDDVLPTSIASSAQLTSHCTFADAIKLEKAGKCQAGPIAEKAENNQTVICPEKPVLKYSDLLKAKPDEGRCSTNLPHAGPVTAEKDMAKVVDIKALSIRDQKFSSHASSLLIESNYLRLNLRGLPAVAYHYDVTVLPDNSKKLWRRAFEQFRNLHFPNIGMAYDGKKSCFAAQKIGVYQKEAEVTVSCSVNCASTLGKKTFVVCIKETDTLEVDLTCLFKYKKCQIEDKPMRALQCLELILAAPFHERAIRCGQSFFFKPSKFYDLKGGYEMYTGLFQSVAMGDQLYLNVDITHKSFPTCVTILESLKEVLNVDCQHKLDKRERQYMTAYIRNLLITYTPPKIFGTGSKTYTARCITDETAEQYVVEMTDGRRVTVAAYYSSKNYKLKYPHLNCVCVNAGKSLIYLPFEFCSVAADQLSNRKDGPRQVQELIRHSATSTNVRKEKIMAMLDKFQHNNNATLIKFGIKLDTKFIDVPMQVLKAPKIVYHKGETFVPWNGTWRTNIKTIFLQAAKQANAPTKCYKWAILHSLSQKFNYQKLNQFKESLYESALRADIPMEKSCHIEGYNGSVDQKLGALKQKSYDIVIVVMNSADSNYAEIKTSAELHHGILTQCLKESVLARMNNTIISDLLLKINSKLGGTNHRFHAGPGFNLDKVFLLGADVSHPSDNRSMPSIVGVVGSFDQYGANYYMQHHLQSPTKESIDEMESICITLLKLYKKSRGAYPEIIIFYRDGVSDSQIKMVKEKEIRGLRSALSKLKIKPRITCLLTIKRHHTRFFPKNKTTDKFNNVPCGTVVDKVIVHPNEEEFFMVSHTSVQGTVKPTRYIKLVDDSNLDLQFLQELTYYLCHMFPRCNRSVSLPAPAYLAHLAAYRARHYLTGSQKGRNIKELHEKCKVNEQFWQKYPMFYV